MSASSSANEPSSTVDHLSDEVEQLRERMLGAGLEVLDRDGLELGAEALNYSRVFAHLEETHGVKVARASVHERIWASNDEFRRDVLAATIKILPTEVLGQQGQLVRDLVADQHRRGLGPLDRLAELSRFLAPAGFELVASRPGLARVQVAKAIAAPRSQPLLTDDLTVALRERGDSVVDGLRVRLAELTSGFGLQPRRTVVTDAVATHEVLGVAAVNTFVGTFLDVASGADEMCRPVAARGVPVDAALPWTTIGLAMEAMFLLLFEPADGADEGSPDIPVPEPPGPADPPPIDVGPRSGRRPRHKLRELVVGAGVEILLQQRLDLRPESLRYAAVFDHLDRTRGERVYRSQIHRRIWDSQDAFWLAVLERAVRIEPGLDPTTERRLAELAPPASDSAHHRLLAARDLIRTLTAAETAAHVASPQFLRRQAVKAALLVDEPDDPGGYGALRRVLHDGQRARLEAVADALRTHVLPLGHEVRPEAGMSEDDALAAVATVAVTVSGGAVFDQAAGVEAVARTFPLRRSALLDDGTGEDPTDTADGAGPSDEWTAPGIATWALFHRLFRPEER